MKYSVVAEDGRCLVGAGAAAGAAEGPREEEGAGRRQEAGGEVGGGSATTAGATDESAIRQFLSGRRDDAMLRMANQSIFADMLEVSVSTFAQSVSLAPPVRCGSSRPLGGEVCVWCARDAPGALVCRGRRAGLDVYPPRLESRAPCKVSCDAVSDEPSLHSHAVKPEIRSFFWWRASTRTGILSSVSRGARSLVRKEPRVYICTPSYALDLCPSFAWSCLCLALGVFSSSQAIQGRLLRPDLEISVISR